MQLTGGGTTQVTVNVSTLPGAKCTKLAAGMKAEAMRLEALHTGASALPYWAMNAHPSAVLWPAVLAVMESVQATGADALVAYDQPYLGHTLDAELAFAIGINGTITTVSTVMPATALVCPSVFAQTIPTGIMAVPVDLALETTPLVDTPDGAVIALPPSGRVDVTWNVSATGTASFFTVKVQEILDNGADEVNPRLRDEVAIVTLLHTVTIARSHLKSGRRYRIQVIALQGYPDAATGSFVAVLPQTSTATANSIQFTVQ